MVPYNFTTCFIKLPVVQTQMKFVCNHFRMAAEKEFVAEIWLDQGQEGLFSSKVPVACGPQSLWVYPQEDYRKSTSKSDH